MQNTKSGPPTCLDVISLFISGDFGHCHFVSDTTLCEAGLFVLLGALLYIQQPSSGSKASLSRLMTVIDVERPSSPQSASRRVLSIVTDNPVNSLQAVWMPRLRPVLARTHWFLLHSFLFSSPTPHTTLVISGCRFTSRLLVKERRVLAHCPRETVFNVYFWDFLTIVVSPIFSLIYIFLVCFSRCLGSGCGHCHNCRTWIALVISLFLFQGTRPLWFWSDVIVLMLRHYMHKTVLTGSRRNPLIPYWCYISVFLPEEISSLVLSGRYSAHATALHAQDCSS